MMTLTPKVADDMKSKADDMKYKKLVLDWIELGRILQVLPEANGGTKQFSHPGPPSRKALCG